LERYLTTEELLLALSHQIDIKLDDQVKTTSNKLKRILNKHVIYWSIVIIAVLHLVFAAIPLVLSDKGLSLLGYRYDITYEYNAETSPEYELYIAVHKKIDKSSLSSDDAIVTYARFGTKYYSVESIIDINLDQQTIETSFDSIASNVYSFDEIEAVYVRRANQVETLYYIFGTIRGYIMLILGNLVVFGGTYVYYINPEILNKKSKIKGKSDEIEKA
jgi:hypothetical protein